MSGVLPPVASGRGWVSFVGASPFSFLFRYFSYLVMVPLSRDPQISHKHHGQTSTYDTRHCPGVVAARYHRRAARFRGACSNLMRFQCGNAQFASSITTRTAASCTHSGQWGRFLLTSGRT